jgi:hypothetical protein
LEPPGGTSVTSTTQGGVDVTFVASRRLGPDSYPAAVDVRPLTGAPEDHPSASDRNWRTASAIPAVSAVPSRASVRMNASSRRVLSSSPDR